MLSVGSMATWPFRIASRHRDPNPASAPEASVLDTRQIECPYCGESLGLLVDASAGSQRYIEDCQVCCRPIIVVLDVGDDGDVRLHVQSEDDA